MKRYFLLLFCAASLYANAQTRPVDIILNEFRKKPGHVMVAAHRAAHSKYPENSLAAVKEAINQGIDIAEIDVRATKDSVLVIMHDATILRTTGQKGKVSDYTYAELQKFPLLFNGKPTAEKIPTFDEVLKLAKDKILIDIDFKADEDYAMGKTIDAIVAHKMEDQALFFLYDHKDAAKVRAINPKIPIMPRVHNVDETYEALAMGDQGGKFPVLHVDDSFYNDTTMMRVLKKGTRVWINALGKYDKMEEKQADSGFDQLRKDAQYANVIQTDHPEKLLAYLRKKGLHK
ncbi:glycerophosphoryl diester phosphodiesterase [Chitinophaga terrae (ex Kim and Jung 2007)]|uniref:glycerophosphodiester phosphodiesterase family protein n=1 Tax=Chitinophaga terrae (ex Kim and Jung 2007) TaxID=408074 RepID=UPI00277F4785|nr:glycerophosphodiester phosphodiesterase family protein [Chitinophaga terrae (ex Kim and Jung 2007)]MDQ0109768.1 glycerophosphoryl diester phosphodiesterase [Chitinophaga terrae (ex Kim and Jung 2007)]